jgi:hypothetical protein
MSECENGQRPKPAPTGKVKNLWERAREDVGTDNATSGMAVTLCLILSYARRSS